MATPLPFSPSGSGAREPALHGFNISPSDNSNLPFMTRMIWVGATGRITLLLQGGEIVLFEAVPAGYMLHVCAAKVFATGTTALLLVGLY